MDVYSKSRSSGPGKGDWRRPTNEKLVAENWAKINWDREVPCCPNPKRKNEFSNICINCGGPISLR